ncbi:IS200/IS605 family transposase [Hydrogenobacter thermophilus]|uniref:IS200/IS605 family transposase n=1 Tax=Hydrogenobacter thermophilus TaxID=940 RepID=UPI0030F58B99
MYGKELRHARTCVYNCNYHTVFSTKYRRPVLTENIETRLKELVQEIAIEKGFEVSQVEVGEQDHVHIFASAHPKISPSLIVNHSTLKSMELARRLKPRA